ncbi:sensor histidine kinase [Hymenobacter sp. PAMC 26628]|uniref:sensor histidine kinase n=1 Tax=Hymenobacter sp. PAMC 26628 TaxID=1484118 RepID=UPI00077016A0|nr:PAS domain-containing protein [Hymenobacter sp. PAMC 26628]AMJ64016.1 hypothetical protein AXW84_00175 [Hymenobacter sp. PAMC 26628]
MRENLPPNAAPVDLPIPPTLAGDAAKAGTDAESLLQALPWGVVVLDAHGTVLRVNQQAAHWWGASPEALQGQRLGPATAGTLPPDLQQALQLVPSELPPPPGTFFLPRQQQWIAMTSAREADTWVVYWQDITAQQQVEIQRQARQAATDALLRRTEAVAHTGSYEMALATGQFHFSDGLFRLFGEEPGEFAPDLASINARSHPDDLAAVEQAVAQAVADHQPYYYQRRIYYPDGQLRTLEAHGRVECDAAGRPVRLLGLLQDVTAREQAAQELLRLKDALAQQATDNYTALYRSMDEGFCVVEVLYDAAQQPTDYRFLDVNPAFEKQTGLYRALGKTIRELVPAIEPLWADVYGRVARTGEPTRFEANVESMSRWFDINAFPIGPPPDRHVAVLFNDITARKQAEAQLLKLTAGLEQQVAARTQELHESRHLLQTVFDASPTAIVVMRILLDAADRAEDFEILLFNAFNQQVVGRDDLAGQRFTAMFPQTVPAGVLARLLQVATTGEPADFEGWYEGEGMQHWFRHLAVRQDGLLVLTSEVITARKLLEQAKAQGLALLQQSEAVAQMGSWDYDRATRELIWSDGLYHLLGRPVGSAVGPQLFLDAVLDDDRPAAARLLRTLAAGTRAFDATLRLRVGEVVKTVRCKGVALPHAPGPPVRVLGVCLDISDVQRLEAENLALKLDRHKELLLAILQAQEDERQRLGEVLHNGLGQVLYATKLHLDQLDTPALHTLPDLSALHHHTNRLLAEAMQQTRTLAHELVPTSLAKFGLAVAVRDVCRDLSTPPLRIECQVWGDAHALPPPVQVTLFRLAQELAHNIVRHAGATQALLELETLPDWVSLRAEDNGRGFDPRAVAEGLGLRTVRDAVALLGGTVAVDSTPEFGTHVRLRIPLPLFS